MITFDVKDFTMIARPWAEAGRRPDLPTMT